MTSSPTNCTRTLLLPQHHPSLTSTTVSLVVTPLVYTAYIPRPVQEKPSVRPMWRHEAGGPLEKCLRLKPTDGVLSQSFIPTQPGPLWVQIFCGPTQTGNPSINLVITPWYVLSSHYTPYRSTAHRTLGPDSANETLQPPSTLPRGNPPRKTDDSRSLSFQTSVPLSNHRSIDRYALHVPDATTVTDTVLSDAYSDPVSVVLCHFTYPSSVSHRPR